MNAYDFYSNNGLHRIFNNHGLGSLSRAVNIPDPDLGIGHAEYTGEVTPTNYMPTVQPLSLHVHPETKDVSDLYTFVGAGGLNIDSFPVSNYYGEVIGEV